jgi:xanthine dehydrogenase YagR molybdenum-binding subunit
LRLAAARFPAEASVQLHDDGTARVASGTQDIGTGVHHPRATNSQKTGVPLTGGSRARRYVAPEGRFWGLVVAGSMVPAVAAAADSAAAALLAIATTTPGCRSRNARPTS